VTLRWANTEDVGSNIAWEALQSGLTVSLIATPRETLKTCRTNELVSAVVESNVELFDYLPVVAMDGPSSDPIVGMFHAEIFRVRQCDEPIERHMQMLSEDHLVGADTSILDFIVEADTKPSRLVVSGGGFTGLVTLSDLQKLPVRAVLFAVMTSFEMTMSAAIRRSFSSDEEWMALLSDGRRKKMRGEIERSKRTNGFVDALLFTQFCDKGDIVRKSLRLSRSAETLDRKFEELQGLRNHLAHANDYASTPAEARFVCALVRDLLALRAEIANASR
jgi:hypothetical protein